jgi:hypothetical protein
MLLCHRPSLRQLKMGVERGRNKGCMRYRIQYKAGTKMLFT